MIIVKITNGNLFTNQVANIEIIDTDKKDESGVLAVIEAYTVPQLNSNEEQDKGVFLKVAKSSKTNVRFV